MVPQETQTCKEVFERQWVKNQMKVKGWENTYEKDEMQLEIINLTIQLKNT